LPADRFRVGLTADSGAYFIHPGVIGGRHFPQGLKPSTYAASSGTAETACGKSHFRARTAPSAAKVAAEKLVETAKTVPQALKRDKI
jgi:hypothetical protein